MPNHEYSEHMPSQNADKAQQNLELTEDWDDDTRREVVRMNRESLNGDPMSFKQGLRYLMEHQRTLAAAAGHEEDDEDRELLQNAAAQLGRDIKKASEGDLVALQSLMSEIESDLEVRARTMQQDGGDSEIEGEEVRALRQTRDALFERYENLLAEQPSVADDAERFLREMDATQVTSEAISIEASTPEISQEEAIKQLGQELYRTGSMLQTPDVPQWFRATLGNPKELSPAVNARISRELRQLYRQHALKAGNKEGYAEAVQALFQQIKDEL